MKDLRTSYLITGLILFVSFSFGQNCSDCTVIDTFQRYWEDPTGDVYNEQSITNMETLGIWTYFKVDSQNVRIDLYTRNIECNCETFAATCSFSIIQINPCEFTFEELSNNCGAQPYWVGPNGSIFVSDTLSFPVENGAWTLRLDGQCSEEVLGTVYTNCTPTEIDTLCNNINTSASGHGDWSDNFISNGNGQLTLIFNTVTVPDKLEVFRNGAIIANSGNYSSNLCSTSYAACIGTVVPGCNSDYQLTFPVNTGDVIDLNITGDVCNVGGTDWYLDAYCNTNFQGPLITSRSRVRRKVPDDAINTTIIYSPNPTSDVLNINMKGSIIPKQIYITNATGQLIRSIEIASASMIVDVSEISSGIYYMKAVCGEKEDIQKIIITR